jgi:hypothetical protein
MQNNKNIAPSERRLVVVEVSGGLAEVTPYGEVDMLHIDLDAFESSDEDDTAQEIAWLGEDLPFIERIPNASHRQRILDEIETLRAQTNQETSGFRGGRT